MKNKVEYEVEGGGIITVDENNKKVIFSLILK